MKIILVVDDEQDVEMLYSQRFRREIRAGEIQINFAFGGEQALNVLRERTPGEIKVVLSDINMPGMTGLELLRTIKTEFKGTKVMMVSAYGDDSNYNTAREFGADDFLTKPVDFSLLKEKLERLASNN